MDTPDPTPRRRRGRRIGLTAKILGAFSAVLVLLVSVGLFAVNELTAQAEKDAEIVETAMAAKDKAAALTNSLWEMRAQSLRLRSFDDAELPAEYAELQDLQAVFESAYGTFAMDFEEIFGEPLPDDDGAGQAQWERYKLAQASAFDPEYDGEPIAAEERATLGNAIVADVTGLTGLIDPQVELELSQTADHVNGTERIMWILIGAGTAIGVVLSLWLARAITGAAREMKAALEALAEGDLTHEAHVKTRDE
ncbi:HAMP domain-containing protein, partial [Demequina aestuarii]|uniref:HAMP domain-containing protein n=1 Tax=Demequina aestuarii TaxID=327095 RepID=UPI000A5C921B